MQAVFVTTRDKEILVPDLLRSASLIASKFLYVYPTKLKSFGVRCICLMQHKARVIFTIVPDGK